MSNKTLLRTLVLAATATGVAAFRHQSTNGTIRNTPSNGNVVIYTDGASSRNRTDSARAEFGVYYGDDVRNVSERLNGRQTNQRAEAMAVMQP